MSIGTVKDRRKHPRRPLARDCWIDPGQPPAFPCRMVDVSESGARVVSAAAEHVPDEFYLYMTRNGAVGRKCQVAWRAEQQMGLKFVDRTVPPPPWLEGEQTVVELEL